jgi:hypothetical protein
MVVVMILFQNFSAVTEDRDIIPQSLAEILADIGTSEHRIRWNYDFA